MQQSDMHWLGTNQWIKQTNSLHNKTKSWVWALYCSLADSVGVLNKPSARFICHLLVERALWMVWAREMLTLSLTEPLRSHGESLRFLRYFMAFWCIPRAPKSISGRFGAFLGPPRTFQDVLVPF